MSDEDRVEVVAEWLYCNDGATGRGSWPPVTTRPENIEVWRDKARELLALLDPAPMPEDEIEHGNCPNCGHPVERRRVKAVVTLGDDPAPTEGSGGRPSFAEPICESCEGTGRVKVYCTAPPEYGYKKCEACGGTGTSPEWLVTVKRADLEMALSPGEFDPERLAEGYARLEAVLVAATGRRRAALADEGETDG